MDWLEAQAPALHTDAVIDHVELFHDCLTAALDWSTRDPAVGLHLLRRLGRPWHGTGRPHAALGGVDALLTEENAERFPMLWVAAALSVAVLVGTSRGVRDSAALAVRAARSWPKRAARSTGSRSANGFSATQKTTAGAYGSSPTSATSDTSSASPPSCKAKLSSRLRAPR